MRRSLIDLAIWVGERFDWLSEQLFECQPRLRALLHNLFRTDREEGRVSICMASDFDTARAQFLNLMELNRAAGSSFQSDACPMRPATMKSIAENRYLRRIGQANSKKVMVSVVKRQEHSSSGQRLPAVHGIMPLLNAYRVCVAFA